MTDQGPLGRPPRGASVPGGAPRGAGPQLIGTRAPPHAQSAVRETSWGTKPLLRSNSSEVSSPGPNQRIFPLP